MSKASWSRREINAYTATERREPRTLKKGTSRTQASTAATIELQATALQPISETVPQLSATPKSEK